jgi:NADH-quinone oxidoreductase subunit N
MSYPVPDLNLVLPEIFVAGMACLILVIDLFLKPERRGWTYLLTQATLVGALIITLMTATEGMHQIFNGAFIADSLSVMLKSVVYIVVFVVFLYSRPYLQARDMYRGEYFVLGLFGMLGMMIMISAGSFISLYLGLELMSLSLYALVAFKRDSSEASEAAMKYFVLGAIASGMLLYGMSMLYGVTGSLDMAEVNERLMRGGEGLNLPMMFGLAFIMAGIAFKLGAVPFHMWLPDVYHGAPTSVTLYLGTAPKLAAFAMIVRLLVEGLDVAQESWQGMFYIMIVLSLLIGNVVAIAQTNIKRMLAYSTISHVAFLLLGFLSGSPAGYASALFYTVVYAIMALGGFGMIMLLSRKGFESDRIDDFRGLNDRSPWLAFIMMIIMFSMAGVPLTAGFYAKLVVLQAVVETDMVSLAVFAVVMSVIGAFYYLRVVKLMYFDKPLDEPIPAQPWDMRMVLSANGLLILAIGFMPGLLMTLCRQAIV